MKFRLVTCSAELILFGIVSIVIQLYSIQRHLINKQKAYKYNRKIAKKTIDLKKNI